MGQKSNEQHIAINISEIHSGKKTKKHVKIIINLFYFESKKKFYQAYRKNINVLHKMKSLFGLKVNLMFTTYET